MPRVVLLPNCVFLSETSRMLAIAGALQARGADVELASHGGPYETHLDDGSLPWTRLEPRMDDEAAQAFLDGLLDMGVKDRPLYPADFIRPAVEAEAALLRGADMAVIGFNLTTYVSCRMAGVPLATSHGGSFVPPVFEKGLAPAAVNPPIPGLGWLPRRVRRFLANFIPPRLPGPTTALNRAARAFGVEEIPSLVALMCGDLTLVTDVPEVLGISAEEMAAWRPTTSRYRPGTRLRYVGPLFARLERPIPPHVEAFLEEPGPVVYVAPTSVTRERLEAMVRAVRGAGVRTLVASTIHDVQHLADDDTCIGGVLPSHRIMPRVELAVIMGGQGSVQCAMTSGTPLIGFPYHGEQELNVALAERQGMGLRLHPDRDIGSDLTRAVRRMLDDGDVRRRARRVREIYDGVDGAANAAEAILERIAEA